MNDKTSKDMKIIDYDDIINNFDQFIGCEFYLLYHERKEYQKYGPTGNSAFAGIISGFTAEKVTISSNKEEKRIYIKYFTTEGKNEECFIDSRKYFAIAVE